MVGLNQPELFERLNHYYLKIYCHKVSAALLIALPLYVNLTPFIIPQDSDNERTLNISLEGGKTHTLTLTLIPAGHCPCSVIFLLVSKDSFFLAISDCKLVIRSESVIFSTIYKKLLFIVLIIFTSTQRFAKQIPISYHVGRAVFQPTFKPFPHGSVHFKIMWSIFVTKLATDLSF